MSESHKKQKNEYRIFAEPDEAFNRKILSSWEIQIYGKDTDKKKKKSSE